MKSRLSVNSFSRKKDKLSYVLHIQAAPYWEDRVAKAAFVAAIFARAVPIRTHLSPHDYKQGHEWILISNNE